MNSPFIKSIFSLIILLQSSMVFAESLDTILARTNPKIKHHDLAETVDVNAKWFAMDFDRPVGLCKLSIEQRAGSDFAKLSLVFSDNIAPIVATGPVVAASPDRLTVNQAQYERMARAGYSWGGQTFYMANIELDSQGKATKLQGVSYRTLPYSYMGLWTSYMAVNDFTCVLAAAVEAHATN